MQPAFPLQARLKFLNNLLVIFILMIAFLKKKHIDQRPIYPFSTDASFWSHNLQVNIFSQVFQVFTWKDSKEKKLQ